MRDEPPEVEEPRRPDDSGEPPGNLRPTAVPVLLGWAVAGLVAGWALHSLCERAGTVPPLVSWAQPVALWLMAAILAYTAWATWRSVQVRRERLLPHQAVNRFVLARACAMVAALVAGGYLGYALSWIDDPAEMAGDRLVRSLVAAAGAVVAAVAALVLERACRVRTDPDAKA
ncbi:DUF3180 domain-containing protein [Nocardioides panacisoli]|uniref:DUF3180 domain-containing protein n=1 Tax=Nocardioides panacisoli TaxID=627624 RepID=A0ABP7IDK1_9ACTN